MSGTLNLHRVFATTTDKLFRAFTDPNAWVRWLPPRGYVGCIHEHDAQVGGKWRMSFTNFTNGHRHGFGGEFLDLIPGELVRYTAHFDEPALTGEMVTTVRLNPINCGVELRIDQTGIPDAIPVEPCYLGWQESLTFLQDLVEPDLAQV